jgi:glycosyltransferase involved in cell wall biosynthesis
MGRLVMLCDVDLSLADATHTHTVELARAFVGTFDGVDLVARGPDPAVDGVQYWRGRGRDKHRLLRLVTLNVRASVVLWRRRRIARHFYVRDSWSCLPAVVFARATSYRIVCQVDGIPYGSDTMDAPPGLFAMVSRLAATVTGRLVHGMRAVTPQIGRLLVELAGVPSARIAVVPNGVDTDFFHPMNRGDAIVRVSLDPEAVYLVYCGGLHSWNDFDTLLLAVAEIVGRRPEVKLLIVGEGDQRTALERRTEELGIEAHVLLTGAIHDRRRVRDYLATATVTLLPYRAEQLARTSASPIKLFEYMACGRGVLAFDYPGLGELLGRSGAGVAIAASVSATLGALDMLLREGRADELGAAGRRYAEEHASWRRVVAETLPLFGA